MSHDKNNEDCPLNSLSGQYYDEFVDCTCHLKVETQIIRSLSNSQKLEMLELFKEVLEECKQGAYDEFTESSMISAIRAVADKYKE